jgi:adenine-specific DNA-methyltransferase
VGIFYDHIELEDGTRRRLTREEVATHKFPPGARLFQGSVLYSEGRTELGSFKIEVDGNRFEPPKDAHWKTSHEGMSKLFAANRVFLKGKTPRYVRYFHDFPYYPIINSWDDTSFGGFVGDQKRIYVVQTYTKVVERCLLLTTDPGDLVLDPTCGSGTSAFVAEQWGRRWITCDTSRVSTTLAKQRLMTAEFDYYELAHPEEGVGSGFRYETVPHVTLKSIANNPEISEGMTRKQIDASVAKYADQETLYDQPHLDRGRVRVTGPFTVEAVPAPTVRSLADIEDGIATEGGASGKGQQALSDFRHGSTPLLDSSVSRKGPTLRHAEWRDELLKTGLRGKGGHHIDFSRVEPLAGTRWLHADAENQGRKARARGDLLWTGIQPPRTTAGRTRVGRGANAESEACNSGVCGVRVRSRGCQGHRRHDQGENRHDVFDGADERGPADRGLEEKAGLQSRLLARGTARRGIAAGDARDGGKADPSPPFAENRRPGSG